jgi:hypothetical protein
MDPQDRSSVEHCLGLPVFKGIRNEKFEAESKSEIYVKLDRLKSDSKSGLLKEYNMKSLQKYMVKLILKIEDKSA